MGYFSPEGTARRSNLSALPIAEPKTELNLKNVPIKSLDFIFQVNSPLFFFYFSVNPAPENLAEIWSYAPPLTSLKIFLY